MSLNICWCGFKRFP